MSEQENQSSEEPAKAAPQTMLEKLKQRNFARTTIIGVLVGVFVVAWVITVAIESMQSTVSASSDNNPVPPRVTSSLDANNNAIGTTNNLAPLRELNNPNTETATFERNNVEGNPTKTISTSGSTIVSETGSRITTTLFEKSKPAQTLEEIKANTQPHKPPAHKPPENRLAIPEQLELTLQKNYQQVRWTVLTQDLLQLEERWKSNFQYVAQQFSLPQPPPNKLSIQTVTITKPQPVKQQDMLWSGVLDNIFEMETLRTAMTDIFIQQLYPQVQPTGLDSLQFSKIETASSWHQLSNQILAIEDYHAEILQTAEKVLCCEQ